MESQQTLIEVKSFPRIQSPSSINMYKQCPRKYFYHYHLRLPTSSSIHLLRGEIVHSALENFFSFDIKPLLGENFAYSLKIVLLELFGKEWNSKTNELHKLGLNQNELEFYHDESVSMLENWLDGFSKKLNEKMKFASQEDAFKGLMPQVEMEYSSKHYGVRGFIDAIHDDDGKVSVIDYKTSSKDMITPEYKLQLAIYALLYEERHGRKPDFVGISFLKFGERMINADDELVEFAKNEILSVHINTASDKIIDYPKNITPLCKWNKGQCDFYSKCFSE